MMRDILQKSKVGQRIGMEPHMLTPCKCNKTEWTIVKTGDIYMLNSTHKYKIGLNHTYST